MTLGGLMADFLSFRLSDEFVQKYADIKPDWGFPIGGGNSLSELTFVSKYSRLKDDGTKEQWYEVCRRCIEGMYSILKDHALAQRTPWNSIKAQKSAEDAFDRMFKFKWLPPGRGLQHMGTAGVHLEHNSARLQNCFSGSEEFITRELGSVPFSEMVGQEVTVATLAGWEKATVEEFGIQEIQEVTFRPGRRTNHRVRVKVTPSHRWILADGTQTTHLKVGDRVHGNVVCQGEENDDYFDGLLHGLVFGDGNRITHRYINGDFGFELRACDSRVQDLAAHPQLKLRWDKVNWNRSSCNGDPVYSKRSSTDLKTFPGSSSALEYRAGFLHGWLAADASIAGETYKLASSNPDSASWLETNVAGLGYTLVGDNLDPVMVTNFGERSHPSRRFSLIAKAATWTVESILEMGEEQVYCAIVPGSTAFTLSSGIYTGNCAFLSTGKISTHSFKEATDPFVMMMEMSMSGIGCGFDTKGANKLTIHEPLSEKDIFIIPDTREGWAESIGILLSSFFFKNKKSIDFDYSQIRPAGSLLKSFGGRASGSDPLMKCHQSIAKQLSNRDGEKISSRDIVDIMNKIGKAVVAGGSRRCLPSGSIVKTTEGPIPIEDLQVGQFIDTPEGMYPITALFDQGIQDTVVVEHAFGKFECTPNHRLAVWDSSESWTFKEAALLVPEDRLVWDFLPTAGSKQKVPACKMNRRHEASYVRNTGRDSSSLRWSGVYCALDGCVRSAVVKKTSWGPLCNAHYLRLRMYGNPLEFRGWGKNVILPDYVTEDLAWLIGMIHGDGSSFAESESKGVVRIACGNDYPEIITKTERILSEICPDSKIVTKPGHGKFVNVTVSNARFTQWVRTYVKLPKTDMNIPDFIWKSPANVRAAYLAGVFDSDGCGAGRTFRVVSSVYPGFSKQIVQMYATLGIAVKANWVDRSTHGWQDICNIDVVGAEFKEMAYRILAPYGSSKLMDCKDLGLRSGRGMLSFPAEIALDAGVPKSRASANCFGNIGLRAVMEITDLKPRAYPVPVVSVQAGRSTQTWDIEVADIHQFTVEGFVSHNSAQIAFGDPFDKDYISLKDWTRSENSERTGEDGWAWNSNNSIFVQGEINESLIDSIILNGEPGFMWLDLAQKYGRLVDPPDNRDYRVQGGNPCLEQSLEDKECCTLVEMFPIHHESYLDFQETIKRAYLYGKAVTLLPTCWPETNEVMARNRRIGCSMSGLAQFVEERGWSELIRWMDKGYAFLKHRDQIYSEWLAVRESIKTTSIKPSGTVSILASVTPGVHWPKSSGLYVRTVRFAKLDPIVQELKKAGYEVEDSLDDPTSTVVVKFVTYGPEVRDEFDVSLWEKAELASLAQKWWADNQVSATLTFQEDETRFLAPLLASKDGQFKGISFLKIDKDNSIYKQAPYQTIDESLAEQYLKNIKPIKNLYKSGLEAIGDKFCDTDVCEIKF